MRFAKSSLAIVAGDWVLALSLPAWVDRYGHRIEEARLPRSQEERQAVAELIGQDGSSLLAAIYAADAPAWLQEIPAVQILRRIWLQNDVWVEGQLRWRSHDDLPAGKQFINSP
jgi:transposase